MAGSVYIKNCLVLKGILKKRSHFLTVQTNKQKDTLKIWNLWKETNELSRRSQGEVKLPGVWEPMGRVAITGWLGGEQETWN